MLHRDVRQSVEQIDAAIFSGDAGGPKGVKYLKETCERWLRGLTELEQMFAEAKEDDDE